MFSVPLELVLVLLHMMGFSSVTDFPPQPDEPPLRSHGLPAFVTSHRSNEWLDVPRLDLADWLWLKWGVIVWKLMWPFSLWATVHVHVNGVSAAGAAGRNNSAAVPRPGEVAEHMRRKHKRLSSFSPLFLPPSHFFFILLYVLFIPISSSVIKSNNAAVPTKTTWCLIFMQWWLDTALQF